MEAPRDVPAVLVSHVYRFLSVTGQAILDRAEFEVFRPQTAIIFVMGPEPGYAYYGVTGVDFSSGQELRVS